MNSNKKQFSKALKISSVCAGIMLAMSGSAHAANWLMLQGTEPADNAPRAKVWGFIQPEYQKDTSEASPQGYIPPKLIGPGLQSQSGFNVLRARIGVRGTGFPLDSHVNYFLLAEFGNNAITNGGHYGHYRPYITDASVTLNYIKGARVRLGLFKYPGSEEGLQGIASLPYINFTQVTNQLMLERYPTDGETNIKPQQVPNADMLAFSKPAGAFRDTGIQVFDAFDVGNWEHSYAVMYGNGNGVQMLDNDGNRNVYLYWSSAYLFDKKIKGPFRPSVKMYGWYQDGKRTNAYDKTQTQDRKRYGVGVSYTKKPFRVNAEYMWGKGMIFQGAQNPQTLFNDNEASGGYLEGGWFIPNTNFELDLRFDTYKRNKGIQTGPTPEAKFNTVTAGVQYHFNKKTRVNFDYSKEHFSSVATNVDNQLKGVKGRFAVEVTAIF